MARMTRDATGKRPTCDRLKCEAWLLAALLGFSLFGFSVSAAESSPRAEESLNVELNLMEPVDTGCRLTMVFRNRLGADIVSLAFEMAIFDVGGGVAGLITLDAGELPAGKTRVKRFALPDLTCDRISRLLLNDVTHCEGDDLSPELCLGRMTTSSRMQADFLL
jgi:hypothetical protein